MSIGKTYLRRKNVTVKAEDPYNMSVYQLKELIWREWKDEWEDRPTSPAYIRLIYLGQMLDDNGTVTGEWTFCSFAF